MNELSLFHPNRPKSYYITHPFIWFRDIYKSLKNFYLRGRYGFAPTDAWNFDTWYPLVGAAAIKYMALNGCSFSIDYENRAAWFSFLMDLSKDLRECVYDEDKENEYAADFYNGVENDNLNPEIRDKYFSRLKEINDKAKSNARKIYSKIGENLFNLWD